MSAARLLNLLASNGLRHILSYDGWPAGAGDEDDDDDEDPYQGFFRYRRQPRRANNAQFPKVPSEEGTRLMRTGNFGSDSHYVDELKKRKRTLATRMMWRELGIDVSGGPKREVQSISQVGVTVWIGSKGLGILTVVWTGFDTGVGRGQNHPFRLAVLLGAVLGRWEFLLLLRPGLQGSDVRHVQPL